MQRTRSARVIPDDNAMWLHLHERHLKDGIHEILEARELVASDDLALNPFEYDKPSFISPINVLCLVYINDTIAIVT